MDDFNKNQRALLVFTRGLEKLSKKTGVTINVVGGVYFDDPKDISKVDYTSDADASSGDLRCRVSFN